MTHALRKYLSSRGSALFMVLSTMTALMIAAMAMYFSVISSRQVQYAVFYEEQSYQSAVSVSDAIVAGLNNSKLKTLSAEIKKLKEPAADGNASSCTFSTNGNDFAAFDEGGTKSDDPKLGAYDLTVTRLKNSNGARVFDFCVTASVNGVQETTHTMVMMKETERQNPDISNLFTATGYTPNTNFLSRGRYYADLDIDSPNVVIGMDYMNAPSIARNLTCAGTAQINSLGNPNIIANDKTPRVWTFGGDLILRNDFGTVNNAGMWNMNGNENEAGLIYVGGDVHVEKNTGYGAFYVQKNDIVYVAGDLYSPTLSIDGVLIVNGTLHLNDSNPGINGLLVMTDKSKIVNFADGSTMAPISNTKCIELSELSKPKNADDPSSPTLAQSHKPPIPHTTFSEVTAAINKNIGSISYPVWHVDWNGDYLDGKYSTDTIVYNTSNNGNAVVKYKGKTLDVSAVYSNETTLKWSDTNHGCIIEGIVDAAADPKNVTIGGAAAENGCASAMSWGKYTIIVDTGDDPDNVFYLGLKPNRTWKKDGTELNVFAWAPDYTDDYSSTNFGTNVLVRGKGSLVIDVPKDVIYQSWSADFIGHENWYMLLGGDGAVSTNGTPKGVQYNQITLDAGKIWGFIHNNCRSCECDVDDELKIYEDKFGNKKEGYMCKTHNFVVSDHNTDEDGVCEKDCCCNNHVGRAEIKAELDKGTYNKYLNSTASPNIHFDFDKNGEFEYPTVNIWLVMADDNAEMMFTNTLDGGYTQNNMLMGYIYAPYMSMVASKDPAKYDSGSTPRLVGGLIVSDIKMLDWTDFIFCVPEKTYAEIGNLVNVGGDDEGKVGDVTWRVYGY